MMTSGDSEGHIFLSQPHMNKRFFFLLTAKYLILYWKNMKKLPENPDFAEKGHGDIIFTLQCCQGSMCGKHVAVRFLSLPWAGTGV